MPTSTLALQGRTALVTGAASGIGAATALALAAAGANLILHTRRNLAGLQRVAEQVQALGNTACTLLADLREPAEQDRLAREAWSWRDGLDLLVNNAGADVLTGDAANWSFERKLQEVWQVDVIATMRLARTLGQQMQSLHDGVDRSIINLGWDQAQQGMAGDSGEMFAASKGAIMAFSRSLAQSLAPRVRVNCVAPG